MPRIFHANSYEHIQWIMACCVRPPHHFLRCPGIIELTYHPSTSWAMGNLGSSAQPFPPFRFVLFTNKHNRSSRLWWNPRWDVAIFLWLLRRRYTTQSNISGYEHSYCSNAERWCRSWQCACASWIPFLFFPRIFNRHLISSSVFHSRICPAKGYVRRSSFSPRILENSTS